MRREPASARATDHSRPAPPRTMLAIVHDAYGPPTGLRSETVPRPIPGHREVLIRVGAAGLDRGTWHLMTGRPYLLRLVFGLRKPRNRVPGGDAAGEVVAIGSAVSRFSVGDEVYGFARGAFAEYAVASEDRVGPKPRNLTFDGAAAVPVSGSTALQAVHDVGRVRPGQRVLVIGASGGVGTFAVQIAKAAGAHVTGVCSTGKVDLVRSLGADRVIDYTRVDFADGAETYDLVLDIGGNPSVRRLRAALSPAGTAVIVGGEEGDDWTGGLGRQLRARIVSLLGRRRLTAFVARQRSADLARLTALVEAGVLAPHVAATYPLREAASAMQRLQDGEVRGKAVIRMEGSGAAGTATGD